MPNESGSSSPSQFLSMPEEVGSERSLQIPIQYSSNALQDIITRQERMEDALKVLSVQNKQLAKENKLLWSEVGTLKTKQANTEKATRTINTQNTMLLKENRYLWGELVNNKYLISAKTDINCT